MAQLIRLPQFLLSLLDQCPAAGAGVHQWLFKVARLMHPFYADKAYLAARIAESCANCGREVPQDEIENAVRNSEAVAWAPGARKAQARQALSNSVRNESAIRAITDAPKAPGLGDLWEASPIRFEGDEPATEAIVDALFPGNPLLCCGRHVKKEFGTGTREEWRGKLAALQFIVPSPMNAEEGHKKNSTELSVRTLENTGPRRFLVVEFDRGEPDTHAAVLWHLARMAPLVMVVHSGGKSLHGWFSCAGADDETQFRFMRYAVSLGADPATWTRCQFVRMPDGLRRKPGKFPVRQHVFHFNPNNLP